VLATTFGITTLVLIFGESAPKSYAVENTESWALRIARPLKLSEYALYPLVVLFDYIVKGINKIIGGSAAIESTYVTRDEIQDIIETGEREGSSSRRRNARLDRIFRFNNTIAKEVMTPRLDVTAVAKESSVEEAIETCIQADHERVPVYEGNLDNIIGVVTVRDLVRELRYSEGEPSLERVVKPTLHVPESKNADELLAEMQDNRLQMVTVIDEFGTTEGIITLEDMVEEIVGEILEGDEEAPVEFLEDNVAVVQGEVNIDEVKRDARDRPPEGRGVRDARRLRVQPRRAPRRGGRGDRVRRDPDPDRARGQHPDHVRAGHRARRRGGGRRGRRGRRARVERRARGASERRGVRVGRDQWESGEEFC